MYNELKKTYRYKTLFMLLLVMLVIPFILPGFIPEVQAASLKVTIKFNADKTIATVQHSGAPTGATVSVYYTLNETFPRLEKGATGENGAVGSGIDGYVLPAGSTKYPAAGVPINTDTHGVIKVVAFYKAGDGAVVYAHDTKYINYDNVTWYKNIMKPIISVAENVVPVLLILVGTAGSIYVIILSVRYSKAEETGVREEAKKHLLHAIIGIVVMVFLLILAWLFTRYAGDIMSWIRRE